jgi:diguanylate cyclase (GGDEF)-like protein
MEARETRGAQVLVVDDTTLVRKVIVARLRGAGYRVAEATDGQEALELFRKEASAVVITDLNMPRLDGLGLLAALRQHQLAPEVILLTASRAGDAEAAVQALRLGAHDYIAKDPCAGDDVVLAVQRATEKWRLREENARLVDDLRRLALTDSLTNVGNRRAFDEALRVEIARARRYQGDLALVIVDLDHFKRVNDTLGHRAGDDVLAAFAARLGSIVRASDRVFRYGGEEFAVLLAEAGSQAGFDAARRLVRGIAQRPLAANGRQVAVTCSAGVAGLRASDGSDGGELVARSDAALFVAKRAGRNRAVRAEDPSAAARAGETASLAVEPC